MTAPRISIEQPRGAPARGGFLELVMATLTPCEGFEEAGASVDGVAVPCQARRLPDEIVASAWCDTRGLPPGLHEITVTGRWAGGRAASERCLLLAGWGEPAHQVSPHGGVAGTVATARLDDPGVASVLASAAAGKKPLALLRPDCTLAVGALERIAAAFAEDEELEVVIGDEATMLSSSHWQRWHKRAFQPEALPALDGVGPVLAVGPRAAAVLRDALPRDAGLYGLALELLDRGFQTAALPQVLALTPQARLPADDAGSRGAIERLAARRGRAVQIEAGAAEGTRDVRWPLADPPEVVAVIPSRTPHLAERCLSGLGRHTDYPRLRSVVVGSGAEREEIRRAVEAAPGPVELVDYPESDAFNYQRAVNLGTSRAGDAHVLFLNDDVFPLVPEWLTRMVELLTLSGVGIVGSLLRHADGRIQHAGVRIGEGWGHRYHDAPGDARGHRFELVVPGNPEAVTGACMLVRGEVLAQLGGHDEGYVQVYGDIDLCFRAAERGWRTAWTPQAELEHLESASFGTEVNQEDIRRFGERWRRDRDPSRSNRVRA